MWVVIRASAQFPTLLFTSALVVTVGFWLLVLLSRADLYGFDADAPKLARALGGTPVAVAASVVIATAWLISLTGTILMARAGLAGPGDALARVALLAVSALIACLVARALARPLGRRFSAEPGPHADDAASGAPFDPGSRRAHG